MFSSQLPDRPQSANNDLWRGSGRPRGDYDLAVVRLIDVAEAAGVSVGLVSRILNHDPATRATPATQERVRRLAAELGYQPHYAARALKLSRTNTIAVALPVLTNVIFSELLRGVEDGCREFGYTMLLARSEALDGPHEMSRMIAEGRVDGFLLQGRDDETTAALARRTQRTPVVLLSSVLPDRPGSVMMDDRHATSLATKHLLDLGHRSLALMNGLPTSETARRREAGFVSALARANAPEPRQAWITHFGYDPHSAEAAVAQIFSDPANIPTAVVIANVNVAVAAVSHLRERGLDVPRDVSVVTVHDAWIAKHAATPLTAVEMPLYDQGKRAVGMLHEILGGSPGRDILIDAVPKLIQRGSVAYPRTS